MERPAALDALLRRAGVSAAFTGLASLFPEVAVLALGADGRLVWASPTADRLDVTVQIGEPLPKELPPGPSLSIDGLTLHALPLRGFPAWTPPEDAIEFHGVWTRDPSMLKVIEIIRNVAETDATVLIRGESGTGKELVAAALHAESDRRSGPFIAVNCGAFSASLLESELFGHVKGAFTGAVAARKGIFAQAHGGTLFLDEVAELPLELQPKLLRVLQERVVVPVGGNEPLPVDVRVVAATHRALREEAREGRFRADLLYRLRVVPIFLPALRERRLDVALLVQRFIDQFNLQGPRRITAIAPTALQALLDHSWPGNVRELKNVVEYAFAVGRSATLTLDDLPPELRAALPPTSAVAPSPNPTDEAERVRQALAAAQGDINAAAAHLGLSRTTFWRLRRRLGV